MVNNEPLSLLGKPRAEKLRSINVIEQQKEVVNVSFDVGVHCQTFMCLIVIAIQDLLTASRLVDQEYNEIDF